MSLINTRAWNGMLGTFRRHKPFFFWSFLIPSGKRKASPWNLCFGFPSVPPYCGPAWLHTPLPQKTLIEVAGQVQHLDSRKFPPKSPLTSLPMLFGLSF